MESKTTHDFQFCNCGAVGIDGGLDYPKRIFGSDPAEEHYENCLNTNNKNECI
ncbi:DUF7695 domain-containing protein [Peribacillus psychrosaccharolyticus]